ncbi:hypothetical protein AAVH_34780, partial [Aphelenchoides avenae]
RRWDDAPAVEASTDDVSCTNRGPFIAISSGYNCTTQTGSVYTAYDGWTCTVKVNFASDEKRVETLKGAPAFPAVSDKLAQTIQVFTGYAAESSTGYTLVMDIEITGLGNVKTFGGRQD